MTAFNDTFGIIGLSSENVGIDRRIYTGLTSTNPQLNVSYNGGRVDVYLNGVKLMGNHSGQSNYDYTYQSTGSGSAITLSTGVALVATDTIECVGYVSNSSNTVTTYTPSVSAGNNTFTSISHTSSDLLNVFLNGVLLDPSDYTADASADTVAITSLASGDVVHIQVIGALDHSNFVPASGGTFSGNVAYTGNIQVDDIVEKTSAHGVEIDGVTLKDGDVTISDKIIHSGDTDTFTSFGTDSYAIHLGGTQAVQFLYNNIYIKENNKGIIGYKTGGGALELIRVGSNDKVQIGEGSNDILLNTSGNVEIASGNLKIGSAGHGIDFSAQTTSSSGTPDTSAGAEVLDHYEKGTFTPAYTGQDSQTYANQVGHYTKIGDICFFGIVLYTNAMGGHNAVKITGLPFSSNGQAHDCGVSITSTYEVHFDTGRTFMGADLTGSGTQVSLYQLGSNLPNTSMTADLLNDSGGAVILQLGGWYRCA